MRSALGGLLQGRPEEKTFWADGWLKVERGGKGISFPTEIFIQFPDKVRLTAFGLFDRPEAYVASNGEKISLFLPTSARFHQGPSDGEALALALGLPPIHVTELLSFLSGNLPLPSEKAEAATLSQDKWGSRWVARLGPVVNEDHVFLNIGATRLLGFKRVRENWRYEVRFSQLRGPSCGGTGRPHRIEISSPQALLRATYSEIEPDAAVDDPAIFTLSPPPGMPILPLSPSALLSP